MHLFDNGNFRNYKTSRTPLNAQSYNVRNTPVIPPVSQNSQRKDLNQSPISDDDL